MKFASLTWLIAGTLRLVVSHQEETQFLRQLIPRDRGCPDNPETAGFCFDPIHYKIDVFTDTEECIQKTDCYFGLHTGIRGPRGLVKIYKKMGSTVDLPGAQLNGAGKATANVNCDDDHVATGGGWKWVGNFKKGTNLRDVVAVTNDSVTTVTPPFEGSVPYGWTVTLWNYGTVTNNKFRAFVHCAVLEDT